MKTLILMRHGKAQNDLSDPSITDFDRKLSERGKSDVKEMGKRISKRGFKPDIIICSPAARTFKTARIVAEELGFNEKKIETIANLYNADLEEVLSAIRAIDNNHDAALMVGHHPSFTGMIGYLSKSFIEHLPTGGYAVFTFDTGNWQAISKQSGKLETVESPDK